MTRGALLFTIALGLAACGGAGGSQSDYATKLIVQSSPQQANGAGFNASAVFPELPELDAAKGVAQQLLAPGAVDVTLYPSTKGGNFQALPGYLQEAAKHADRARWVYVYDELFWESGRIAIGAHEPEIVAAAHQVQQAGLKSSISILPEVILTPGFALQDPAAFDVIMIDAYPSLRFTADLSGCNFTGNTNTQLLHCSVQKLRDAGFKGEVWYIYQAFGDSQDADLVAKLQQQRETIALAPSFGVTGLVSFGFYMKPNPGPLYAGEGSPIASLVGVP